MSFILTGKKRMEEEGEKETDRQRVYVCVRQPEMKERAERKEEERR